MNKKTINIKKMLETFKDYIAKFLKKEHISINDKDKKKITSFLNSEKFRKIAAVVVILIFILAVFKTCSRPPKEKKMPARPIETAYVIKKDARIYINSFGTLTSINDVDIKAQVTGKILEVHFKQGNFVKIGDPLFTIDPSEYEATLKKAQATLEYDLAQLKLKQDTLNRNVILIEKDLISKQDFETLQTDFESAKAQIRLDVAAIDLAKINLNYCFIVSPINGIIGKRLVDPGNIVMANQGPTLVNIKSIDPFYLDFTISEKNLDRTRNAMGKRQLTVEIYPEQGDGKTHNGNVLFMDNDVDDETGTVLLRAEVPNKENKLWPGQFVTLKLILKIQKDAVLAPYKAVSIGQDGHYLFAVTKKNTADLRLIELGERQDDYIIINKGVKPGEKVVTVGSLGLAPNVPVKEVKTKKSK